MLFNSLDFAVFLPLVFMVYWLLNGSLNVQNGFLTLASYVFYGWWDWRFLGLIVFSTLLDYSIGLALGKTSAQNKRKALLYVSMLANLGLLGFFKYFNFFLDNLTTAFTFFGASINTTSLTILLPVGISFYTFQTMSYTIDVYRNKLKPTRSLLQFSAFVGFFPQLVAGPIERANQFLPQFKEKRSMDYAEAVKGVKQMLWGLFKKVVIADNCATYADLAFNNPTAYSGGSLFLGALFFAFQIYGDFSGYTDIAIGCARLFGFRLMQNFAFPYFSRDIAEFWRRWHISLSTWFRDYVYIPLGGSRGGKWLSIRNTLLIFLISGFWHGANWTFVLWGALHALYFLPLLLGNKNRRHLGTVAENSNTPTFREWSGMLLTFCLTTLAWVLFRAESVMHACDYFTGMASGPLFHSREFPKQSNGALLLIAVFVLIEWKGRASTFAIESSLARKNRWLRWSFYALLLWAIGMFMRTEQSPFIYFQF
jgi:alginate O-acetyltransferase complex protein AlgI